MQVDKIKSLVSNNSWTTAISIKKDNQIIFENKFVNTEFKTASLIKLGIALYIKEMMPNSINENIYLKDQNTVGGAWIINRLSINNWKISDLIDLMLSISDNTATNALLDYYKLDHINNFLQSKYINVHLNRYLMQESKKENLVSCNTIMNIFEDLLIEDNKKITHVVKNALAHQENRNKLVAFSSIEYKTYNKTGELLAQQHDIARFYNNKSTIDCCVMTNYKNIHDYKKVIQMIQKIGQLVSEK